MKRPEESLHRACVSYLRASLPKPWFCWHTANGMGRTKAEAGILKAMGVLAGMPDVFVIGPQQAIPLNSPVGAVAVVSSATTPCLIAIEFKAPPKRLKAGGVSKAMPRLSPAQRSRQVDLGACGVPYLVVDDMAEMIQALKALRVPLRGRAM